MEDTPDRGSPPRTDGRLIHWAFLYDLLLRVLFVGKERAFRNRIADLARLAPGESVLDVGCGTGTLAIVAKQRVGAEGTVSGIDASPAMISRARQKALTASANVDFRVAAVEALPWPDAEFDVVLSTAMLHHLPDDARRRCLHEIRRVLKPKGRLLAVDFGGAPDTRHRVIARFRHHARFDLDVIVPPLRELGFGMERGDVEFLSLRYVRATLPTE
jgi:ubiquinone/menaquinone biosynthesis C-methylase UbiE